MDVNRQRELTHLYTKNQYLMLQIGAESGVQEYVVFGRNEPALHHYHNTYRAALGMPPLEPYTESPQRVGTLDNR